MWKMAKKCEKGEKNEEVVLKIDKSVEIFCVTEWNVNLLCHLKGSEI